ncbi:MAG: hypothetical protein EHM79_03040 [Geobacter sp.]|nr:MAG: hypothetical protein EHM79_03040 [Geobacter sp.]
MNQNFMLRSAAKLFLLVAAAAFILSPGSVLALEKPRQGEDILLDNYHRNKANLEKNNFGLPIFVESIERDDRAHVDVYGIIEYPFSSVVKVLQVPASWCEIVSLTPNVKACTYQKREDGWQLTFYFGRKVYQPPEDSRQVICHFRKVEQRQGYLDIVLSADAGPFSTKNHRMRFEALSLDGRRTFVRVSYSYSESVALRLAERAYFATFGRSKVGFTVIRMDGNGKPVYIGGRRGAIERNAVRNYLAIQTFMDTLRYPEERRLSMRLSEWYNFASRFRKQLLDLEKQDYLTYKTKENKNQVTLQRQIGTGLQ